MHQQEFRQECAICRLRHEELLDAAHILPDGHPRGEPVVPNGLALCNRLRRVGGLDVTLTPPGPPVRRPDVVLWEGRGAGVLTYPKRGLSYPLWERSALSRSASRPRLPALPTPSSRRRSSACWGSSSETLRE